ncbi:MAG: hypothetical protein MRZ65_10285, partial [Lachnospiraceae bacterium]|nr:hypothetical protein [Lachnospiraceae bacterium]
VIQISLGGSPISFQDEASGGLQRCAEEKCHAKHDNPRSKYAKAYLKYMVLKSLVSMKKFIGRLSFDQDELLYILEWKKRLLHY